ncbi:TlyA family RNA methyltransferase [Syntrophomonas palmitatica]|uniref:TlyA family RNA methyltransferase n=1 Tax=Syntrophomonas palmitatica TaxID=402877 RepID=UPI0006D1EBCC|nr:TlyA family RNA methyltransferase [Syntrophomonas palmitatica]
MAKIRLDLLLQEKGWASSREKARAFILAGEVAVDGRVIDKAGTLVEENAEIEIRHSGSRYVSRGGLKLEKAIREFGLNFEDKLVLDVGASTGGYTDCALQHGAARVYALDVGYGQLDWSLRNDPRVVCIERTNIRYFTPEELSEKVDIITVDVSFISTALVFPVIQKLIKQDGDIAVLIKPQFEAGKNKVGKKGVVKDVLVHREVLLHSIESARLNGLTCLKLTYSPITGPQGNIEFFLHLRPGDETFGDWEHEVVKVVEEAHKELGGH